MEAVAITVDTPPAPSERPSEREAIDLRFEEALAASKQGKRERARSIVLDILSDISPALGESHRLQAVIYSVAAALTTRDLDDGDRAAGDRAARDRAAENGYTELAVHNARLANFLSPTSFENAYLCASLMLFAAKEMDELKGVKDICEVFLLKFEDSSAAFIGLIQLAKVKSLLHTNFESEDCLWFTVDNFSTAAELAKRRKFEDIIPLLGPIKEAVELYWTSLNSDKRSQLSAISFPSMLEKYETLYNGEFYLLLREIVVFWKKEKVWAKWSCPCNKGFTNADLFQHHIKEHSMGLEMQIKAVVVEADCIIDAEEKDGCLILQGLDYDAIFGCNENVLKAWKEKSCEKRLTAANNLLLLQKEVSYLEVLRGQHDGVSMEAAQCISRINELQSRLFEDCSCNYNTPITALGKLFVQSELKEGLMKMATNSLGDEGHILNLSRSVAPVLTLANPTEGNPSLANQSPAETITGKKRLPNLCPLARTAVLVLAIFFLGLSFVLSRTVECKQATKWRKKFPGLILLLQVLPICACILSFISVRWKICRWKICRVPMKCRLICDSVIVAAENDGTALLKDIPTALILYAWGWGMMLLVTALLGVGLFQFAEHMQSVVNGILVYLIQSQKGSPAFCYAIGEIYKHVHANWTTGRCAICRWVEDWDFHQISKCNLVLLL